MKAELELCGLDTEDDGEGNPLLFGAVFSRGRIWARDRHVMLDKLSALAARLGGLEVWLTNMEYDLLNLFGIERIGELSLRFGKSYLVGAKWKGRKIDFRDTIRHVPVSVEKLGELIGKVKLEKGLFVPGRKITEKKLLRRCLRDAAITYQTARRLRTLYREVGGRPRLTLASSAYHIWKERYWKREIHRPNLEQWQAAFEAYYGGRTEPFSVGTFEHVRACDASSMFPWAMLQGDFPVPWGPFRRWVKGSPIEPNGFYRARVVSELPLPVLPYRSDHGLIFPNGSWSGWYVGSELECFKRAGGKVRILSGFAYAQSCRPFDGYIKTMFKRKNAAKGARRLFYKLLLNALYGKFGQRGERVVAMPLDKFEKLEYAPTSYRIFADFALFSEKRDPPPWGNNVWSAIVTARARERLWQEMARIERAGGKLLYCDTDGVLFQYSRMLYPAKAVRPGDFESRGTFKTALIRGKKEYALQDKDGGWQFFAKGVPEIAREMYLTTGEAEFRRPTKLRESARSGEKPNVWRAVRKVRRVSFGARVRSSGELTPIVVNE